MNGADKKPLEGMFSCMETGSESAMVLTGALAELTEPIVFFVRLAHHIPVPQASQQPDAKFIFVIFTPTSDLRLDAEEIGRSMATLLANKKFQKTVYAMDDKAEIFTAINEFLEDSMVLPPGDWDRASLLPVGKMIEMRKKQRERMATIPENVEATMKELKRQETEKGIEPVKEKETEPEPLKRNPLMRTSMPFGGLIDDIKYRYKVYLSDIKDGLNAQVVAATIFIYFACLSGAIAFGGLMGSSTKNLIGIPETLILSSVGGTLFALFAGCPLIITGTTGPVLLYDQGTCCAGDNQWAQQVPCFSMIRLFSAFAKVLRVFNSYPG